MSGQHVFQLLANAVLAALFERSRSDQGQFVEVPMIDALTSFTLVEHGSAAIAEPPQGPAGYRRIVAPERRPFRTSDGWMAVLPYSARNYDDLFRAGGRSDLLDDPRVRTASERNAHAGALYAEVEPIIADPAHDVRSRPIRRLAQERLPWRGRGR